MLCAASQLFVALRAPRLSLLYYLRYKVGFENITSLCSIVGRNIILGSANSIIKPSHNCLISGFLGNMSKYPPPVGALTSPIKSESSA